MTNDNGMKATEEMNFEEMMEKRIQANFAAPDHTGASATNDKLKEMSKKLPSWSLEPPYSFLK